MNHTRRFAGLLAATCMAGAALLGATVPGAVSGDARTRDMPPPGHTGGFGEPTCETCHFGADLDGGPGALRLVGLPDTYEPERRYTLEVVLAHDGVKAAGFQVSIRDEAGVQAGTIEAGTADTERTAVTRAGGITYVHHTYDGSIPASPDTARWTFTWTAPPDGGTVVIHGVANAADADDSPLGDFIYSTAARSASGKTLSDHDRIR